MRINKRRVLLDAVAKFWQGYSSLAEAETSYLRRWSNQTLSRGVVERAILLLDACALVESNRRFPIGEYAKDGDVLYTSEPRDWNGIRLSIYGVDVQKEYLPSKLERLVLNSPVNSLFLCVLPSSYINGWQDFASKTRAHGRFILPVFPIDVNALARGRWSLLDLVEYKLYRIAFLDKDDVESQYGEVLFTEFDQLTARGGSLLPTELQKVLERLDDPPSTWVDHPELDRLVGWLRDGRDILLVGPSSSGKSVLAFEAGLRLISGGTQVRFVDVGLVSPYAVARALSHLKRCYGSNTDMLVLYDNLQSSPSIARYLLMITSLLRYTSSARTTILAITWPSYGEEASKQLPSALNIVVNPSDVQRVLLAKHRNVLAPTDIATMSEIAKDDVLLWKLLLDAAPGKKLTKTELAKEVWRRRTKGYHGDAAALKRAGLIAALLGQYEFELSEGFLAYQAGVSKSTIRAMVRERILRRTVKKLVLGHRSICILLTQWLASDGKIWEYFRRMGKPTEPIDIINRYIRTAEVSEVWAILKKLQIQVGFKGSFEISNSAQVLVDVWKSIDSLIERIEQQQFIDPTWGKNLASCLFAIEALCAVGKREKAKPSIDFMRSQWSLDDGSIQLHGGTTERLDFDKIHDAMREEDQIVGVTVLTRDPAKKIDPNRFHQAWVKGIILCAEAVYGEASDLKLQQLAIAVESEQEPDGNFYPRRVPWCTARVLTGLARCGRSYTNSSTVKKSCDWLLRSAKEGGPYQEGVWESGTGAWNTPLEVTSMCIIALTLAGISSNDQRLTAALDYIISKKAGWTKSKRELDGANAIAAYLALVGTWKDITPELQYLLKWARGEAFWGSATKTAKELSDQSPKVAFIADYLVEAAWSNLKIDLPDFLEAFAVSPLPEKVRKSGVTLEEVMMQHKSIVHPAKLPSAPSDKTSELPSARKLTNINQVREQTASKILLEFEAYIQDLRAQLRELKAYREELQHARGVPLKFEELESRYRAILNRIKQIELLHEAAIAKLQAAASKQVIEEIYQSWQNELMD